ncbi:MAG: hypothetical protein NWF01_12060 [Candidatus Bathyarchaeota archaeon]|nr:hypothetical protein [Candidatus Bathyarchaeota archaeon]
MENEPNKKIRAKWMQIWLCFQQQIATLPPWAQDTLLDDINTAVQSRIVVLQKAHN